MALTFLVSLGALSLLFATLCKYELTAKHTRAQIRALRRRLAGGDAAAPTRARSPVPSLQHVTTGGAGAIVPAPATGSSGR
jgi:hypothetical protein